MFKANKFRQSKRQIFDNVTLTLMVVGVLALLSLVYYQVRPLKLADIKVPVATDLASYYPSQSIGGIFFGDTYYNGQVKILREVFCKNYRGVIEPPKLSADGNFFNTQSRAQHLDGENVAIGYLPKDIPIGSNCVLQFTNVYDIKTPFGTRHEEYQYYTQNFSITTKERRQQLDCEATGKTTAQCTKAGNKKSVDTSPSGTNTTSPSNTGGTTDSSDKSTTESNTTTNNTTNNNQPPAEPVTPPQSCGVDLLGIKLLCE